jgi:hypothetical protein
MGIIVFVIIGVGYTKEEVIEEIRQEGYKHEFNFDNSSSALQESQEVWCFGRVNDCDLYHEAVELGKDIWIMG